MSITVFATIVIIAVILLVALFIIQCGGRGRVKAALSAGSRVGWLSGWFTLEVEASGGYVTRPKVKAGANATSRVDSLAARAPQLPAPKAGGPETLPAGEAARAPVRMSTAAKGRGQGNRRRSEKRPP